MSRFLWMSALVIAVSAGCGDSPVGPARGSFTSTLTFVEPTDPTATGTCCPSPCASGSTSCAGACNNSGCCPASHCDKDGRHK